MAISNVQHLVNDEMLRTRIDHMTSEKAQEQNKTAQPESARKGLEESLQKIVDESRQKTNVNDAIAKLSQAVQIFNKKIKLSVHEESKRVVVKILDRQTDKVIREIPGKEVLNFISKLHQLIGVLIDKKQ